MGKIMVIREANLIGGKSTKDPLYPVTSSQAVYHDNNERLDDIIDQLRLEQCQFGGVVDVTSSGVAQQMTQKLTASNTKAFFICGNANKETSGGYAICDSTLATRLHPSDTRGVAVNLGDIILVSRYGDNYYFKLIAINEAKKPSDAGGVGTYGLMVPNDKEKLDKAVSDIDTTVWRCYQGEYNMNYCGWYGYYMYGTLGRPAGSVDGEKYLLRVANVGVDGDYIVLEQTAYSSMNPANVFRRIVKTKDRSKMDVEGNTEWGTWTKVCWNISVDEDDCAVILN